MGYRVIFLANSVKLSVKNEQLVIDNGEITKVPIEDIECVVADTPQLNITSYLLSKFSEYCRICNGNDDVEKHKSRIRAHRPDNGSVRLLVVTEKQYEKMKLIIGNLVKEEEPKMFEQLSIF